MKKFNLKDMAKITRGWFVGDFEKAVFKTKECEVAYKTYRAGDYEKKHLHKVAIEITLIIKGKVIMNGVEHKEGDIIVMEPGEATDFKALTDAENVVVKIPSVIGDKYSAE